jgi:signal peptidase I
MAARSEEAGRTTGRRWGRHPVRGAVSGLILVLAVCALAMGAYQTASGHWHATPVLSGSMRPGLQPGDVVVTQRVPITDLRVRDVIVFHPPNEPQRQTVHRIVKLRVRNGTTSVTTRGDANTINDPTVTALGGTTAYRVVRVVPLIGYPAVWLSGGHHGLLVIGLGLVLLVCAVVTLLRPEAPRKGRRVVEPEGDGEDAELVAVPAVPADAGRSSPIGLSLLEVGTDTRTGHAAGGRRKQGAHTA